MARPAEAAKEPQNAADNTTMVNFHIEGDRVPYSVKIDKGVKEAWREFVKTNGLSSCEIFEKIMIGFMAGFTMKNDLVNRSPTINVVVDYPKVVKRVRRRQIFFEDEQEFTESFGNPSECWVAKCRRVPKFLLYFEEEPGHTISKYCCDQHFIESKKKVSSRYKQFGYRVVPNVGFLREKSASKSRGEPKITRKPTHI